MINSPNNILVFNTVKMGDLNNNGLLDIVTGYDGMGIYLWLNNPDGTYQLIATPPATTGNYNDLCIGDINNDGKPDIVASRAGGLSAWLGDGTGNGWSSSVAPSTTGTFNAVTLDDINIDGNLDIVSAVSGTGVRKGVQVFLGDGNGGWSIGDTNLPYNTKYNGIDTGDFNNDGKTDIVAAGDNGVDAWTGNGLGTWTLTDNGLPNTGSFSDVEITDFDHDGDLDMVATGGNNNGVIAWKGNGAGSWEITTNLPLSGSYTSVETYDVNIDGYMDIIATSTNSNQMVWTGDGMFNWFQQNNGLPSGNSYIDVSIGDVNTDGRVDMCIINSAAGIELWLSSVERTVNLWGAFPPPSISANTVNDIEICDINLDGKMDICYATQTNGIQIWAGNGLGAWTSFPSPLTTGAVYSIVYADYNNDGKPDIIATTQNNGIRSWKGNGLGTWTLTSNGFLPTTGTWYGLAAADFNDDGKIDIAGGSGTNGGIFVWNSNGAEGWVITINLPFIGTYYSIDTLDINLDGAIDIVTADGGIRAFLGNANNGWTESSTGLPSSSNQYKTIAVADINSDGMDELIGASENAGVNIWTRSTGQWNLDSNVISSHGTGLSVGDFTIDGRADVCVGSSQNLGIESVAHNGENWPSISVNLPPTGNFATLELADINIDGRLDIITYNNTGQTPNIWVGDYAAPPVPTFSIGPLTVGWNLISIPLQPVDTSLPAALEDLDGDTLWTRVKSYDRSGPVESWKTYSAGITSTLTDITESMGLWVYIPDAGSLGDGYIRLEGYEPVTTSITLEPGWNLVGYPSSASEIATNTVPVQTDMISVYQATSPYIQDFTSFSGITMEPGKAYWIHVTSATTWVVDY